jgi:hypothetical protein
MQISKQTAVAALAAIVTPMLILPVFPAQGADAPGVEKKAKPDTLLFVRTTPAGAEVRLDGKPLGTSNDLFPVGPGTYRIVVDLRGHQPYERLITICHGKITRIELTLEEKQPAGAASGTPSPKSALRQSSSGVRPLPNDAKLNEGQRLFRDCHEDHFLGSPDPLRWESLNLQEKAAEETRWLKQLCANDKVARISAINALVDLGSKKAVPGLLKIATDRKEVQNNRDRWMAVRALGIIGDQIAVPDLVHLTYHHNQDTRLWAQISLVRLTGQNFGRDVAAWKRCWEMQGGQPPISAQTVTWTTRPEMADPQKQDEFDRQFVERLKRGKLNETRSEELRAKE